MMLADLKIELGISTSPTSTQLLFINVIHKVFCVDNAHLCKIKI